MVATRAAVRISDGVHELGEGPRWDGGRQELVYLDALAGRVHRARLAPAVAEPGSAAAGSSGGAADAAGDGGDAAPVRLEPVRTYDLGLATGCLAPAPAGWVVASGHGFALLGENGELDRLVDAVPDGHRMNDGACDPYGRFLAGSLGPGNQRGAGALHRLDATGDGGWAVTTVRSGMTMPNGIGWSPDGLRMYHADSGSGELKAFGYHPETGEIVDAGQTLVAIDPDEGVPDGLAVDAEGAIWLAVFGAAQVRRYDAEGGLLEVVTVPVPQPTSPVLAGPDGRTLVISTGWEHMDAATREEHPGSGALYAVRVEVPGPPATPWSGREPAPPWA